jgi:hypothetical protein
VRSRQRLFFWDFLVRRKADLQEGDDKSGYRFAKQAEVEMNMENKTQSRAREEIQWE